MNFEYFLYQYLLKHNNAEVPGFGVFHLTKESAKIDAENSIIIPPKESVSFRYSESVFDNHLAKYIAEETHSNLFIVQNDLKNEVNNWFHKLKTENFLSLENLGQYQLDKDNKVIKIKNDDSDVFGFEEVNLQQLKILKPRNIVSGNYSFNKNVIWTFLSVIILASVALLLFGDKEMIFGKSSKIPTKQIVKNVEPKKAVAIPKQDSIKIDSIKPTTNAEIQKTNR